MSVFKIRKKESESGDGRKKWFENIAGKQNNFNFGILLPQSVRTGAVRATSPIAEVRITRILISVFFV